MIYSEQNFPGKRIEIFRILLGPEKSTQTPAIEAAIGILRGRGLLNNEHVEYVFEFLTLQEIVKRRMSAQEYLHWCSNATYLAFGGHPLQNDFGPLWDHEEFLKALRELSALKGKKAFPPAKAIRAAFTQDKWEIYLALRAYMLEAFRVDRPTHPEEAVNGLPEAVLEQLFE